MREAKQCYELLSHLSAGELYTWQDLKRYSNAPARSVTRLLEEGLLTKVGPGLYLPPKKNRFGEAVPTEQALIKTFLKTDDFLFFSSNQYNLLRLGLTQLTNQPIVYNKKRHEKIMLSGRAFSFRRPNNGYPSKLTPEFLLVDLVNNIKSVGEPTSLLKSRITQQIKSCKYNSKKLLLFANKYGKVGTKKFFNTIL